MSKAATTFELRLKAANNLKRRAIKQKAMVFDVVNERKIYDIGYWYGYVEALKDIKNT